MLAHHVGPANQGSVAVIRISGSQALQIAKSVFRCATARSAGWQPQSHRVYYGHVVDASGRTVDEVLCLCMLSPRSYTMEDVIELHCHGGAVCVQRVLHSCVKAGARLAKPGEFTLRAFLNGRLDLSQVLACWPGCLSCLVERPTP